MLFEHEGDNRSGKTFLMAVWGFFDWIRGQHVYANCRPDSDFPGSYDCFLNYPHRHYDPYDLRQMPEVYKCTVITDEAGEILDSRKAQTNELLDLGYWGKEATKAGVDWHWDTVYHDEIEKRIRKKWHYQVKTTRIPRDPNKPLLAIRVETRSRYEAQFHRGYFPNPRWNLPVSAFYGIYNDQATLRRRVLEAS